MSETKTPQPSSDNFWSEASQLLPSSLPAKRGGKKSDSLYAIDEVPDFYDPYSDLNLFLAQKIKQEMANCGFSKKWSLKIQEELLRRIAPEFQKRFPNYRLGIAALKKTWEKIAYYSQQLQSQKEAIAQDGRLNIHFFIKENLKAYFSMKSLSHFHPAHFAHQLATKMSECIAAIEGIRPKLDHLAKLVWSIQRNLLSGKEREAVKSPYDEYDGIDKLIVKTSLEVVAKEPEVGYNELEYRVKEGLNALQNLPTFRSPQQMMESISTLIAEKLYPCSELHTHLTAVQKKQVIDCIRAQHVPHLPLAQQVRKITSLCAAKLGQVLSELGMRQKELLEVAIWKTLGVAEGIDSSIRARIDEEITNLRIDQPKASFSTLVHATAEFFQRTQELGGAKNPSDIDCKIHTWAVQGDMLCRWIRIETDSPLLHLITETWRQQSGALTHAEFMNTISQKYLKDYPELAPVSTQLSQRIAILYKYAWYTLFSQEAESSYDRFLKWHIVHLKQTTAPNLLAARLEELVKRTLPVIPFDKKHCEEVLHSVA